MTSRRALGDFGERVARAHLEAKGYRVLATNFRVREGEVDIVAERGGVVAFVEVKTRRGDAMGSAVEAVDARQAGGGGGGGGPRARGGGVGVRGPRPDTSGQHGLPNRKPRTFSPRAPYGS